MIIAELTSLPDWPYGGTSGTMRIYAVGSFWTPHGQPAAGALEVPAINTPCVEVAFTVNDRVFSLPVIELAPTTDSPTNPAAGYVAWMFDETNTAQYMFLAFNLPVFLGESTTWGDIALNAKKGQIGYPSPYYLSAQDTYVAIANAVTGANAPVATTVRTGSMLTNIPATDSAHPVGVVANTPIITGTDGIKAIGNYASLSAAVSAIGSEETTLWINEPITTDSVTIPSTLKLKLDDINGVISVNSGQTLTINSPFPDPGNRQIFDGDGHKIFGVGAASQFSVAWYYDGTDKAAGKRAIDDIITSIANQGVGVMFVPAGVWKTEGLHEAVSGMTWEGVGMDSGNASQILLTSTVSLMHIGPSLRNIQFSNLCLKGPNTTNSYGVVVEGHTAESTIGITFKQVRVENFDQGLRFHALTAGFEMKNIWMEQVQIINPRTYGIYCDSINTDFQVPKMYAKGPAGYDVFHMEQVGVLNITGGIFEGPTSAPCVGSAPSPTVGGSVLYLGADHGCVNIQSCEDEGMGYFLTNDAQTVVSPILLANNFVQSLIQLNAACWIFSAANNYFRHAFRSLAVEARVWSAADQVRDTDYCGNSVTATPNGLTLPARFVDLQDDIQLLLDEYFALVLSSVFTGTPTRPAMKVISEEVGKYLLQIGTATNNYSFLRDNNGWLQAIGSQAVTFRGFGINGGLAITTNSDSVPVSGSNEGRIRLSAGNFLQISVNGGPWQNLTSAATAQTINRIQKATANGTLGNSNIQDDGTNIEILTGLLQFLGTTASFPALKRSSTTLKVRLADDSADAPLSAAAGTFTGALVAPSIAINGGAALTSQTGTGAIVLATSPTLVTPQLGAATVSNLAFTAAEGGGNAVEQLLATNSTVDLNTATATTLFTVPAGRSCIITRVIIDLASTSLTTASWSYGWTGAAWNDVIATATHTELTGATLYTILLPKTGAKIGVAAGTFKTLNNVLQGGAATCRMRIFGMIF